MTIIKVAWVTGASSGIGRATALAFARQGIHVAGIARRKERLDELAEAISNLPVGHGEFLALAGDVTDADSLQKAVDATLAQWGRIDILVANAGVGQRGAIADADWAHLETLLRTNIDGVLHSVRAVVPTMRQQGNGHIITISSVAYNLVAPYAASYAASKAFVSSIANSLRIELQGDNIFVSDFLVGRTNTEFNEKRLGEGKRSSGGIPTMSPEKVADAIVRVTQKPRKTVVLRLFDRLLVLANRFVPNIVGYFAARQYR
jgi:short-subunit dehydrogenase